MEYPELIARVVSHIPYTDEPGIYLPGRNGVRIEDAMVVTKDGSKSLSDMPQEIRVVG